MGCMMGFSIDALATLMNTDDSEDTASANTSCYPHSLEVGLESARPMPEALKIG